MMEPESTGVDGLGMNLEGWMGGAQWTLEAG